MKHLIRTATTTLCVAALAVSMAACSAPAGQPEPTPTESSNALADLVPADIAASGTLVVATGATSPPEGYTNDKGELAGYEIAIINEIGALLGLEIDWQVTDFASLIPGLQSGRSVLAVGQTGITAERAEIVDFVTLILTNQAFAAKKDAGLSDVTIDDLCGLTVAVTQGSRQQTFGDEQSVKCVAAGEPAIDLVVFQSANEAWLALQSDRAEIFWSGATAVGYLVSQVDDSEIVGNYLEPYPTGIALAKDGEIGPAVEAALQELIDNGKYQAILDEWGLSENAIDKAVLNPEITW